MPTFGSFKCFEDKFFWILILRVVLSDPDEESFVDIAAMNREIIENDDVRKMFSRHACHVKLQRAFKTT